MQGIVTMSPGPLAPPLLNKMLIQQRAEPLIYLSLPSLKMTALSYSWTICLELRDIYAVPEASIPCPASLMLPDYGTL